MKLIIVESPTKCETIKKYLGKEYNVVASYGHIRDLSTSGKGGLGVNILEDFKPTYIINKDKVSVVATLKKYAKKAEEIFLATDPDREGEAISWHLADVLGLDIKTTKRLEFHEITKSAILKAINNPRTINMDLVASQETRRIIDRIMGFKLSSLMKRKIGSISAGRVQSVTLKLITEKEKEIESFIPEEYWNIDGIFNDHKAVLDSYNGEKIHIKNEQEADDILNNLPESFIVESIDKNKKYTDSQIPFRTSSLQQVAYNTCKFSTKVTQSYAQKLFEIGLITYIRTDGTGLAKEFIEHGKEYITNKFGNEFLASKAKLTSLENQDNSSMAHEAIRPTSLENTPELVKQTYHLERGLLALYKLIYNRSIAALMSPRVDEITTVKLKGNNYCFILNGTKNVFEGYSKVYKAEEIEEEKSVLYDFILNDIITPSEINKHQHFTKGPTRYNEAKVVKTMEELGIGRPSTYASTIATLYARDYIKGEKGILHPTEQGINTINSLIKYFEPFMETNYTAKMESELDEITIEDGTRSKILNDFYTKFEALFEVALKTMEKGQPKESGNICPKCGKPLVFRKSKFGEFEACSGFPDCDFVKKQEKEPLIYSDKVCPKCGKNLVLRKSKKGEFFACSGFPKCNFIEGQQEEKESLIYSDKVCPKCGKQLVVRKSKKGKGDFLACSGFPKCRHIESIKEEK